MIAYDDASVTFIVLDNALFQGFESNRTDAFSRAVCYRVTFPDGNELYGGTVQQLWSADMEFYSPFLGSSYKTSSGNYIFTFGTIGTTFGTTGENYSYINSSDTEKRSVIIELNASGEEQGRLTVPTVNELFGAGVYRAERIGF